MTTVSTAIYKPGIVWKMSGDVYKHFPWKDLLDKVRPWFAFICACMLPTAHLRDVSRERAILLYEIITSASIEVGRVIFDNFMQSVWSKVGGIGYP